MEREHLIIIALIFIALCMMNKGTNDTVMSMGPLGPKGRIRYTTDEDLQRMGGAPGPGSAYIRTRREGFYGAQDNAGIDQTSFGSRIRYSDKHFASSQHIKNHIRNRNMNSMFSGMMGTGCEPFRFTCPEGTAPQDCPTNYP
jgi:hypothetical protein